MAQKITNMNSKDVIKSDSQLEKDLNEAIESEKKSKSKTASNTATEEVKQEENTTTNSSSKTPSKSTTKKTTSKSTKSTTKKTNNDIGNTGEESSLSREELLSIREKDITNRNGKPIISDRQMVVEKMKMDINDILPTMNIDLNNIIISDSLNTMEKHTNLELVFNSKPTFEVALCQSCYTAFMESLKYDDVEAISSSTLDEYHTNLQVYQIIHKRMQATSIGKMDFDTFLECTSYFDLPSLMYGLQLQTFPGDISFNFKCRHCDYKFSQGIPGDTLVFSRDDKVFEKLDEVRRNATSPQFIKENSLVAKHERICLNQSKTIMDIRIPSLKDYLDILKSVPDNQKDELSNEAATILFVKSVFLLNVPETLDKKQPVYYEVSGLSSKINVVKQLSIADAKQLGDAIDKWTSQYKTEYQIPSFNCPSCHKSLGAMPVDIENILFQQMLD